MMRTDCDRAEVLAGAVALGEATDAERDVYRRHIAGCARCIAELGGERDIERTMETVALARDAERWTPDILGAYANRNRTKRNVWSVGAGVVAAAFAISIALHALVGLGIKRIGLTPENPIVLNYDGQHIVLEHRPPVAPVRVAAAPAPQRLLVVHNVVTLAPPRAIDGARPRAHAGSRPLHSAATGAVASLPAAGTNASGAAAAHAGSSRGDDNAVAMNETGGNERALAALRTSQTAPPAAAQAESIAVVQQQTQVVHDVLPVGGMNAIVPHPSRIAYDENAEGTTAFEVSVDEHGTPVKCTITKPSGFLVLDAAVCQAAMRARYMPRTINGRAVASVYRDAFTFRSDDTNQ